MSRVQARLMDTDAAARLLGCTPSALNKFRSEKRGPPYIQVGRLVRYRRRDLLGWIKSQRVLPQLTSRNAGAGHDSNT